MTTIRSEVLQEALSAAGNEHHEFEKEILDGKRDENWKQWYAAYLAGSLGLSATTLTLLLDEAEKAHNESSPETEWQEFYAEYISQKLE